MTDIDINAIRARVARHQSAIGPGGDKAWAAGLLANDVPVLLTKIDDQAAEIQRLRAELATADEVIKSMRAAIDEADR